jgi:hypothetical protein
MSKSLLPNDGSTQLPRRTVAAAIAISIATTATITSTTTSATLAAATTATAAPLYLEVDSFRCILNKNPRVGCEAHYIGRR